MKMYINFDNETKKVDISIVTDEFDKFVLSDAMPYIIDELYELVVKEQKRKEQNKSRNTLNMLWGSD